MSWFLDFENTFYFFDISKTEQWTPALVSHNFLNSAPDRVAAAEPLPCDPERIPPSGDRFPFRLRIWGGGEKPQPHWAGLQASWCKGLLHYTLPGTCPQMSWYLHLQAEMCTCGAFWKTKIPTCLKLTYHWKPKIILEIVDQKKIYDKC